jgi:hypothetical protein
LDDLSSTPRVEPLIVWGLVAIVGTEILVTYSRLPARELYHVSGSGLEGGASRVLVFLNFPVALIAIAIIALLLGPWRNTPLKASAALSILLSAAVFWPGVVDQADLDARPVNAIAAIGVGLAFALTAIARRDIPRLARPRPVTDRLRVATAAMALLTAVPWLAAELGFYLDCVPLLGWIYRTGAPPHGVPAVSPALASVHHGHHHGMDGVLLVWSALLLSRLLPAARGAWRAVIALYLSLMLAYGAANIANDFWLEQVAKRGWSTWVIPSVLQPRVQWAWGVIVLVALVVWWTWFREDGDVAVMSGAAPISARSARRRP